jgi:hypothetical protein
MDNNQVLRIPAKVGQAPDIDSRMEIVRREDDTQDQELTASYGNTHWTSQNGERMDITDTGQYHGRDVDTMD